MNFQMNDKHQNTHAQNSSEVINLSQNHQQDTPGHVNENPGPYVSELMDATDAKHALYSQSPGEPATVPATGTYGQICYEKSLFSLSHDHQTTNLGDGQTPEVQDYHNQPTSEWLQVDKSENTSKALVESQQTSEPSEANIRRILDDKYKIVRTIGEGRYAK